MLALVAASGGPTWTENEGSVILSRPLFFQNGESALYTIDSVSGLVRQHAPNSGVRRWDFNCDNMMDTESCYGVVEAELR